MLYACYPCRYTVEPGVLKYYEHCLICGKPYTPTKYEYNPEEKIPDEEGIPVSILTEQEASNVYHNNLDQFRRIYRTVRDPYKLFRQLLKQKTKPKVEPKKVVEPTSSYKPNKNDEIDASKKQSPVNQIKEPEKGGVNYLNLVLIGMGILFFVNMEALGIILSVIGFAIIGVMLFAQLWIAYVLADAYAKEISKGTKYIYWIALVILVVIIFIGISPR